MIRPYEEQIACMRRHTAQCSWMVMTTRDDAGQLWAIVDMRVGGPVGMFDAVRARDAHEAHQLHAGAVEVLSARCEP